jgi:hypothetical protein
VHNFYGATASLAAAGNVKAGPLLGIGLHLPLEKRAFVDIDILAHLFLDPDHRDRTRQLYQARAVLGIELAPRFSVYAGPTYSVLDIRSGETPVVHTGFVGALRQQVGGDAAGSKDAVFWPGLVAGVQVL